jgi:hypothetical protein
VAAFLALLAAAFVIQQLSLATLANRETEMPGGSAASA